MTALSLDGGRADTVSGLGQASDLDALSGLAGEYPHGSALLREAVRSATDATNVSSAALAASDLTPVGAPLEAAFVWPSGAIRVSVDPCPGAAPAARRRVCLSAMAAGPAFSRAQKIIVGQVLDWQQSTDPRYGAWLGLRPGLDASGQVSIRSKLYLDVPQGAPWGVFERELVDADPVLPSRSVGLTMIGLDPVSGSTELYWRCNRLFPAELDTLLRRFRLPERGGEITSWIADLASRSIRFELPAYDMGFSCTFDAGGTPQVFTWYANATSFLGPPERCRAALLRVGERHGWPVDDYALISRPDPAGVVPMHGIVGASVTANGPMATTATVAMRDRKALSDAAG